jgi:MFS transporter, DHA2 family, multidrug resistance protein
MRSNPPGLLLKATIFLLAATDNLQSGMTAFAAGPIMGETGVTPEDFSLIAAVYATVAILVISMQRWFVERLGGRPFVQLCAAVSVIGSVLCATSHDFSSFLAGRIVMAVGGGAFFTCARMIIQHLLAGPRILGGIRSIASGVATGIAVAPWAASVAVSLETWSAIYWLVASLGAVAFVLASLTLSPEPLGTATNRSDPDLLGQTVLVFGSFLLLYSLQRFYYDFYGDVALAALALGAAVLGLAVYLRFQYRAAHPLLRVREVLHVRYLAGIALFAFAYAMLGANNYMVPLMLQRTLGYSWETVGHFQALSLAVAVITVLVLLQVMPRAPAPQKFLVTGFLSLTIFGFLLTRINSGANLWFDILPALAFNSVFLMTVMPTTAMQTFRGLEKDEALFSNAQQIKNMLAQAGVALGITLATLGQQWRTAVHYSTLNAQINPANPIFAATLRHLQETLTAAVGPVQAARIATAQVAQMLYQQSSMLANIDHFTVIAALGTLGVLVTLVQRVFR